MTCRKARKLFHQLLDGTLADPAPLNAHLDVCPACLAALATMRRIGASASACAPPLDEDAALERLTAGVLAQIAPQAPTPRPARLAWAPVAAVAGMMLAFAVGYGIAPREASRAQLAAPLQRALQVASAPQAIVRDRVVTREVPVYRERIVYRDRVVSKTVRVPVVRTQTVVRYVSQPAASAQEAEYGLVLQPAGPPAGGGFGGGPSAGLNVAVKAPPPQTIVEQLPSPVEPPYVGYSESVLLAAVAAKHSER